MHRKLKCLMSSRKLCLLLGFQTVLFMTIFTSDLRERLNLTLSESHLFSDIIHKLKYLGIENDSAFNSTIYRSMKRPENVSYVSHVWQLQEGKYKIFLYSAFFDDRPALEIPQIRVIAVTESSASNVTCLFWHKDSDFPDAAPALRTEIGIALSRGILKFKQVIFSCKLNSSHKPEYVSIVTSVQPKPTNLLKLHYPEKPPASKVIEFGHCLSVLYWTHDPLRIVEWVELLKLWGVEEFNVYASSLDNRTRNIFKKYPKGTVINFHEFPDVLNDSQRNSIRLNMGPAINDCMYRNMYRYKHVVCFDTDEMIVPILHSNYSAMLKAINKEKKVTHPHPSYMFRNVYFFTDLGAIDNDTSNILHAQRYLRHIKPSAMGYSSKSITDPQACAGLQNHYCWHRIPKYDHQGWDTHVRQETGMNFHFKKCHFDEYLHKPGECAQMMANYTTHPAMKQFSYVYPAVVRTLKELSLL